MTQDMKANDVHLMHVHRPMQNSAYGMQRNGTIFFLNVNFAQCSEQRRASHIYVAYI